MTTIQTQTPEKYPDSETISEEVETIFLSLQKGEEDYLPLNDATCVPDEETLETIYFEAQPDHNLNSDILFRRSMDRYMLKQLTQEEMKCLSAKAQSGDSEARNTMALANLRLVIWVAKRYLGRGLEFCDLFGEGCIGLMIAIKHFNPQLGTFSNYAKWWISSFIRYALAKQQSILNVPAADIYKLYSYRKEQFEIEKNKPYESSETPSTLKEKPLNKEGQVDHRQQFLREQAMHQIELAITADSLQEPLSHDSSDMLINTLADPKQTELDQETHKAYLIDIIRKILLARPLNMSLPDNTVIDIFFRLHGLGDYPEHTLDEAGKSYKVPPKKVRLIDDRLKRVLERNRRELNCTYADFGIE